MLWKTPDRRRVERLFLGDRGEQHKETTMRRHWLGGLLLAGLTVGTLLVPTWAEEKKEVAKPRPCRERAQLIKHVIMAGELAEFSRKYRTPEGFIMAAGLLQQVHAEGDL